MSIQFLPFAAVFMLTSLCHKYIGVQHFGILVILMLSCLHLDGGGHSASHSFCIFVLHLGPVHLGALQSQSWCWRASSVTTLLHFCFAFWHNASWHLGALQSPSWWWLSIQRDDPPCIHCLPLFLLQLPPHWLISSRPAA